MSYYWCNRQEILLKAKERYSKEKVIKEKSRNRDKNLSEEKKKQN